eukprot:GHVS01026845.1.p1 GENE.GHVS01026845.1~~GHVS01026845.1.p1  ORF type:complete len:336 (+),score=74.27 GHVS01026845.1:72-1079(+)
MAHLHFGRAVPLVFRCFPTLPCRSSLTLRSTSSPSSFASSVSLSDRMTEFPGCLEGRLNLLIVGFRPSHWEEMKSWFPFARRLQKQLHDKHGQEGLLKIYTVVFSPRVGGIQWIQNFMRRKWLTVIKKHPPRFKVKTTKPTTPKTAALNTSHESLYGGDTNSTPNMNTIGATTSVTPTSPCSTYNSSSTTAISGRTRTSNSSICGDAMSCTDNQCTKNLSSSDLEWTVCPVFVYYDNRRDFIEEVQLPDAERAYVILIRPNGSICWAEHEEYERSKEKTALEVLRLDGGGEERKKIEDGGDYKGRFRLLPEGVEEQLFISGEGREQQGERRKEIE